MTDSTDPANPKDPPQKGLANATVAMAAGTAASRLTGVLRLLALAYALGATRLATSFNLANTTPNMLYDIVLGGVLSATFIPVFVDRLSTRSEKEAWRAISAVVTLSVVVLVIMTAVFWLLSPEIIDAYTAFAHVKSATGRATLSDERAVGTSLLRWFVPQIALYGMIALMTALLNARRKFVAPMWVPIANNLVCIAVLLDFAHLTSLHPSLLTIGHHRSEIALLGLGTTAGVGLQMLLLIPALRGARLGRLSWRFDPRHEAVTQILRLSTWTFGFVVLNQVALYVVLALAVGAKGLDPVASYTYAYAFMQMPYAVIAVSVMSALTPDLSSKWSLGDRLGFTNRLSGGLRATLAAIIPASIGMLLLAKPTIALLLGHGATSSAASTTTASALSMFSLGLPGFCTFLFVIRVLQSMQRTKVAFWLYLVENGLNIALAVVLVTPLGVRGLALSLAIAYTVSAIVGIVLLRTWLYRLGDRGTWQPLRRVIAASVVMGIVAVVLSNLSGANHGFLLFGRVLLGVVGGGLAYFFTITFLGRRAASRREVHLRQHIGGTRGMQTPDH